MTKKELISFLEDDSLDEDLPVYMKIGEDIKKVESVIFHEKDKFETGKWLFPKRIVLK